MGVFKNLCHLAARGGEPDQFVMNITHVRARRVGASLVSRPLFSDVWDAA